MTDATEWGQKAKVANDLNPVVDFAACVTVRAVQAWVFMWATNYLATRNVIEYTFLNSIAVMVMLGFARYIVHAAKPDKPDVQPLASGCRSRVDAS